GRGEIPGGLRAQEGRCCRTGDHGAFAEHLGRCQMSSIYEALKRTQVNRPVASGAHAPQGIQARRIFWILAAAILISSAATTALLYGVGVVGKARTAPLQVTKQPQANPERIMDLMNKAERLHTKGEMLRAIDVY